MTSVLLAADAILLLGAAFSVLRVAWAERHVQRQPRPVAPTSTASPPPRPRVAPEWMLLDGPREALRMVRDRRPTYQIRRVA